MVKGLNDEKFKKNDSVVVFGSSKNRSGVNEIHRSLAKIISVGKYDVFVKEMGIIRGRQYRVSKNRCFKIDETCISLEEKIIPAKPGDLVLSFVDRISEVAKHVGVVTLVSDIPGRAKTARLMVGESEVVVPCSSLIILERNGK